MNYKLLFVLTPALDPHTGGVQMSTYKLAKYFSTRGIEVSVYSTQNKGHMNYDFLKLFHADAPGGHKNTSNVNKLAQVIREVKPNIVINQMPYEHSLSKVLKSEKKKYSYLLLGCLRNTLFSVKLNLDAYIKKQVPEFAHVLCLNSIGRFIFLQIHKHRHSGDLRKILDNYDHFVMFGPPNKKEISYFVGDYKSEKLAYMPNSIPDVLPVYPQKEKVLLHLGKLTPGRKRVDLLLPVWQKIYEELPDWQFWIVGDGAERTKLEQKVKDAEIPRVKFFGKQPPYEYYEKAKIFIMTSSVEGFPNVLIEAQSRGAVPVVMNSYPVVSWMINHDVDGVLIKPFDTNEMAARVLDLAKNENRLASMGKSALSNAEQFTVDVVGEKWVRFFNEKMKNKN